MIGRDIGMEALQLHHQYRGKIEIKSKVSINDRYDLSLVYTPGVAKPCQMIAQNSGDIYKYTNKGNQVAVISDGSAVLGLGNIGGKASLPVMEGKCILFKKFGGIDAFPICLNSQDPSESIATIKNITASFGGINLEDFKAPQCFLIEERLKQECDIPVFHDDQHGTAVIVLAGLYNALKITGKQKEHVKIVVNGIGAAGTAICKLLHDSGFSHIIPCDRAGVIYPGVPGSSQPQQELAKILNPHHQTGGLEQALRGADVFIGVSAPGIITPEMIKTMADQAIVFALANPEPEILPEAARAGGAGIIATGRSDYPNQINNVLAFPGIFRGALDVRASVINETMKIAAAKALAEMVPEAQLTENIIVPTPFDPSVCPKVAAAVAAAAQDSGVAALKISYQAELYQVQQMLKKD